VLLASHVAFAQAIPIRQLSEPDARSAASLPRMSEVRELRDRRVVFTAMLGQTVTLCEADLRSCRAYVDSTSLTPGSLPSMRMSLLHFPGDSIAIVDASAMVLVMLDASGRPGHVVALPHPRDASMLSLSLGGLPRVDPNGRLVYRARYEPPRILPAPGERYTPPASPDSYPVVRVTFETRAVDTLAVVAAPGSSKTTSGMSADGKLQISTKVNPLPVVDDWALLSDGTVAIVRGHDYHVDWVDPDGTRRSTPKMPFDWRRITDDEKMHIIDSVEVLRARMQRMIDSVYASGYTGRGAASAPARKESMMAPSELPDYYPPIRLGSVLGDRDGNVWVLPGTSLSARGGLLYDVVNREGSIVERVQLPPGCSLVGFGSGGVVYYMQYSTDDKGTHLFRAHIVR